MSEHLDGSGTDADASGTEADASGNDADTSGNDADASGNPADAGHDGGSDQPLELREATYSFGRLTAVAETSLAFEPGTITAVVGPNGSGKTTLLELLAGLRAPDTGTVSQPKRAARSAAYLPQTPRFRSGFTARATISFYADLVEDDVDPTEPLSAVGLESAADRRVEALSGGMTRLLGLAQALVGDPPAVLLDEPTSGLDPDVADHIFETVERIASDDRTVVITTHDLAVMESLADRVLVIVDGAVVLDGTPAALLEETDTSTLRAAFSTAVREAGRSAVEIEGDATGGERQ